MRFTLWTLVESRRKVISVSDCYLFMSHITHLLIIQLAIAMAVRGVGLGSHSSTNLGSTSVGNCAVVARAELGPLGRWLLIAFLAIFSGYHLWLMPFAGITASSGFLVGKVWLWVKRRYAPELLAENEGHFQPP
jgi:hypothetical protein